MSNLKIVDTEAMVYPVNLDDLDVAVNFRIKGEGYDDWFSYAVDISSTPGVRGLDISDIIEAVSTVGNTVGEEIRGILEKVDVGDSGFYYTPVHGDSLFFKELYSLIDDLLASTDVPGSYLYTRMIKDSHRLR